MVMKVIESDIYQYINILSQLIQKQCLQRNHDASQLPENEWPLLLRFSFHPMQALIERMAV